MRRNQLRTGTYMAVIGSLPCLSFYAAMRHTIMGYVLLPLALLFFVRVIPVCRKRENLYMFFLVAVCSVPMNLSLIFRYIILRRMVLRLVIRPVAYLLMLSVEEIVMGYITRVIWRRQYRLPYYDQQ